MPEFLEAMEKLIKERIPKAETILMPDYLTITTKYQFFKVRSILYDDRLVVGEGITEPKLGLFGAISVKFDITNPEFNPEIIIKWLKDLRRGHKIKVD